MRYILILLLIALPLLSQPNITNYTADSTGHKDSLIIYGNGFGTKSPAAPVVWDDLTGMSAGDAPPGLMYNAVFPVGIADSGFNYQWNMQAQDTGYRNVPAPHPNTPLFYAGGHWWDGTCDGQPARNVMLFIRHQEAQVQRVINYERLDPLWPSCGNCANYKHYNIGGNVGYYNLPSIYSGAISYYAGGLNLTRECGNSDSMAIAPAAPSQVLHVYDTDGSTVDSVISHRASDGDRAWKYSKYNGDFMTSPSKGMWVHHTLWVDKRSDGTGSQGLFLEGSWNDTYGFHWGYGDDKLGQYGWDFNIIGGSAPWVWPGLGCMMIGGFYRYDCCPVGGVSGNMTHRDAFRYWHGVYYDTTLAMVAIGDSTTYQNCTIFEPQIPYEWTNTSIKAVLNHGRLTMDGDTTHYLLVSNSENQWDSYPIILSSTEVAAPPAAVEDAQLNILFISDTITTPPDPPPPPPDTGAVECGDELIMGYGQFTPYAGAPLTNFYKMFRAYNASADTINCVKICVKDVIGAQSSDSALVAVYADGGSGSPPGDLIAWSLKANLDWNDYDAATSANPLYVEFPLDSLVSGKTRVVAAGAYYWITFNTLDPTVGTILIERGATANCNTEKRGGGTAGKILTNGLPPLGSTFTTVYGNSCYGWSIW